MLSLFAYSLEKDMWMLYDSPISGITDGTIIQENTQDEDLLSAGGGGGRDSSKHYDCLHGRMGNPTEQRRAPIPVLTRPQ